MQKSKCTIKVVTLDGTRDVDEAEVGPKAMSLVRLGRIGVTVPAGFCITATACREHLEQNKLIDRLKSTVDELADAGTESKRTLLSELRAFIVQAPMSQALRREIESHYRALSADRVAVRSSGTAEDLPGHSFAGQHETYLGVSGLADCTEAVKKCWASLWTLRAFEYRRKNGFDHLASAMAVIVQSLVGSDSSGVIFTVDPVTGSRSNIVIEACFGLGEALVSGKVTPDRFVVGKKKLKLRSQTISEKKIQCVVDADGTIQEQAILKERASICCLNKKQIRRLAKLARKVEAEFGCPQDIEWAIGKTRVYFLQSRPITALPPEKSWEDRQIWCSNPAREVMPDVVTPMTLSAIDAMLGGLFDPVFDLLCMDRGEHSIYGLVAGRIYFNANIWGAVFRDLPGTKGIDFKKATGSHKGFQKVIDRLREASDEDLPDLKFKQYKLFLKIPLIVLGAFGNTPNKGRRILAGIEAENEKWSRLNPENWTTEELQDRCQQIMTDLNGLLSHVMYLFSMISALLMLDMICNRWFPDGNVKPGKLMAGIGGMVDAAAGLDIWRLAASADSQADVRNLVLSHDDWHTVEGKLSETDSGREFLDEWNRFMLLHGHHCRGELELYNARWSETPNYILKFVRSHITQTDRIDPVQNFATAANQRRDLEQQCRRQLRNPIKRMIFDYLLTRAQHGSVFRENVKSEVIKLLTAMRKLLIELGKRLHAAGTLTHEDDIFFLRLEEIEPVVTDKADFDIRQVAAARRAEYDKNCSVTPPDVVFGRFDPEDSIPETWDEQAQVLNGVPVSPGVVTGKARVILRADSDQQLLAGEILVAPFTDPGWTPYFVLAAGIVMDEGGVISHGSIVAREYGIPAVVNVGGGTKIIRTGQTIQVDGNQGVVRILG